MNELKQGENALTFDHKHSWIKKGIQNRNHFFLEVAKLNHKPYLDTESLGWVLTKPAQMNLIFRFQSLQIKEELSQIIQKMKHQELPSRIAIDRVSEASEEMIQVLEEEKAEFRSEVKHLLLNIVNPMVEKKDGCVFELVKNKEDLNEWTKILVKELWKIDESVWEEVANMYLPFISHPKARVGVLKKDGKIVSTSLLWYDSGLAGVYAVATRPDSRKLGFGNRLMLETLSLADKDGFDRAYLFATNEGYPLYLKLGFQDLFSTKIFFS